MLTEFRNAVSCKKSSRLRRRRPLSSSLALRHPTRITLGAPRPLRLVREMRLSNGKLYSGTGPLTGSSGPGGVLSDMGPGPQRLLEDPLGANSTPTVALGPPAVTVPLPRGCTHCAHLPGVPAYPESPHNLLHTHPSLLGPSASPGPAPSTLILQYRQRRWRRAEPVPDRPLPTRKRLYFTTTSV